MGAAVVTQPSGPAAVQTVESDVRVIILEEARIPALRPLRHKRGLRARLPYAYGVYVIMIQIEFDPGKDAANRRKHGFGLAAAAMLFEGLILRQRDDRGDYGEERCLAVGTIGDQAFTVCYTMRGEGS
jgi:uncharacterized DUF497 family protein